MRARVCVCVYVCVCVCVYVCVCIYVFIYVCMYVWMCVDVCIIICLCIAFSEHPVVCCRDVCQRWHLPSHRRARV